MSVTAGPGVALILLALVACAPPNAPDRTSSPPPPGLAQATVTSGSHALPTVFHLAQGLAEQIRVNLREDELANLNCVVTTFVDIDDLAHSSRFGRLLAEAVGAELFRQGAQVTDIRSAKAFLIEPKEGELVLSRDVTELAPKIGAQAAVVGTYGIGASSVAVTIRLLDLRSDRVLSVAMAEIARTPTIDQLLLAQRGPTPTAYDRLPTQ